MKEEMISKVAKVGKQLYEVALRARLPYRIPRFLPRVFPQSFRLDAVFRRPVVSGKSSFFRMSRLVLRHGRAFRPFSNLSMHRFTRIDRFVHQKSPVSLAKRAVASESVFEVIRKIFRTNPRYNRDLLSDEIPSFLDAFEIGENIGYGSNAAVYALRKREMDADSPITNASSNKNFPLALKLMFNYEFDHRGTNDDHLWKSMGAELAPLPDCLKLLKGRMGKFRPLPSRHPNIVRMFTAFVDRMPVLPDAKKHYPEALPSAAFYDLIIDEPKTLFVVMKRYRMTLRDYVSQERRNYWTGRVLLGQLLEGLVFLYDNKIAQRDMKSDNILLEFDHSDEAPFLVISDFGCAHATGSWTINYKDDTMDLGGNLATRAPEIKMAKPGENSVVDFSMADTWAAGGLAYEIFTRRNPFYSSLKSETYLEEELPVLSSRIPQAVRSVIRDILKRDPQQRQIPHVAANVVCLSLFRFGNDVRMFLSDCGISELSPARLKDSFSETLRELGRRAERSLNDVVSLLSAESIIARGLSPPVISDSELQLRATFLSRVNREQLWESIGYFFEESSTEDRFSLNNISDIFMSRIPDGIHPSPRICVK